MGQGGYIELVNGTPYTWSKTSQQHKQMNKWGFPVSLAPGQTCHTYVEWSDAISKSKDYGETVYTMEGCPNSVIKIQADNHKGYAIHVQVSIPAAGKAGTAHIGWKHNKNVSFVLSGDGARGYTMTGDDMSGWLAAALPEFGGKRLNELCLVGSHDAGMYRRTHSTPGAENRNTLTQSLRLYEQLCRGVQYLDIRPVLYKGTFYTGHYGSAGPAMMGATGMSIDDIICDLNRYTSEHAGLVILNLSHDMCFDSMGSTRDLSSAEWKSLLQKLQCLHARTNLPQDTDLTRLTLRELIGSGPAVLVICEDLDEIPQGCQGQGFYLSNNFSVYNEYSNTNNLEDMVSDQLDKMKRIAPNRYFLLSWTLTESPADAVNPFQSIIKLADNANQRLVQEVYPAARGAAYPNILYMDNIKNTDAAVLACALCRKRHSLTQTDA